MHIVDLSMTVSDWEQNSFAPEETYFKLRPIVNWEEHGFVSNMVEMTVHAGTHIDSPHHFFRDMPSIDAISADNFIGDAVVVDLSFKGHANARITVEDMKQAEAALAKEGITLEPDLIVLLRTDWPSSKSPLDPAWWNESPCLTKESAEWIVSKLPRAVGFDFAQEEKGDEHEYEKAEEILSGAMRVHKAMLPKLTFQIENLINLDQLPSKLKVIALPAKWHSESAPARVIGLID
jgi:kynurenine formamidase